MHELLLFAQVPASRHAQLLKIIAGIAGMQPQRVIERHLIFKPQRAPGTAPAQVGGSQGIQTQQAQALQGQMQGELFHIQLVGDVEPTLFPTGEAASGHDGKPLASATEDTEMKDANGAEASAANDLPSTTSVNPGSHQDVFENQSWSLRFSDLPEVAGRRPVTSRMISWVDFVDGNVVDFMDAVGYNYASEYILEGHRVIQNNVVLLLHRILRLPASDESQASATSPRTSNEEFKGPRQHLPPFESLQPVDPRGTYMLQASVRVQDGTKPESMTLGINELRALKDTMKGIVDLEIGDRLALDTRVR